MPNDASFKDQSIPGGIVHNPASAHSREMAKWEMGYNPYGQPGRPREQVGYHQFPAMFYKMTRTKTGGAQCVTPAGVFYVEHYQEAGSEAEAYALESQGYRMGQSAAIDLVTGYEQEIAVAAAERAFADKKLSEKARAEAAAADDASPDHVAEVPEKPVKPRGRPKKSE